MLTYYQGREKVVQVMDFSGAQIITFTMKEFEKDMLPPELKEYMKTIEKEITEGRWDYWKRI